MKDLRSSFALPVRLKLVARFGFPPAVALEGVTLKELTPNAADADAGVTTINATTKAIASAAFIATDTFKGERLTI